MNHAHKNHNSIQYHDIFMIYCILTPYLIYLPFFLCYRLSKSVILDQMTLNFYAIIMYYSRVKRYAYLCQSIVFTCAHFNLRYAACVAIKYTRIGRSINYAYYAINFAFAHVLNGRNCAVFTQKQTRLCVSFHPGCYSN